jgi:hypothetical protein
MIRAWILIALLAAVGAPVRAETVYEPGRRTWANQYVPPHYETRPDTRYVGPKNQPLDALTAPSTQAQSDPRNPPAKNQPLDALIGAQKPPTAAAPPVSVFTPAPQYDPYYNALNAASRPIHSPKPRSGEPR